MKRFLITGGSGAIASAIRPLLASAGHSVRLLDVVQPREAASGREEFIQADLTDPATLVEACRDIDLVVHLGGIATERSWDEILSVNIAGTQTMLESAHRAGVKRVLLASSVHAVGFATAGDCREQAVLPPQPDTFYGVSKVALEALGSVYASRHGMSIVSARIANFAERPDGHRGLAFWFSAGDMVRLIEACVALEAPGHHICWGISANSRGWALPDAGAAIGFHPQDDAEAFADEVLAGDPGEPVTADTLLAAGFLAPGRQLGTAWK